MSIRVRLLVVSVLLCAVLTVASQTYYSVLRLIGPFPDGLSVVSRPTLGSDGLLYGVTFQGGSTNELDGAGTVFRLTRDGRGYSILKRFTVSGGLPRFPNGTLTEGADGRLYGVLYQGGTANNGGVFAINRDGTGYVTLYNFLTGNDGALPIGQLCEGSDGVFYGVTQSGGNTMSQLRGGTVFKINANGTGYVVMRRFVVGTADGHFPSGGVIEGVDGVLYGTTYQGGTSYGQFGSGVGTVYRINRNGTGHSILWNFNTNGTGGLNPRTELLQASDHFLYGVTERGGSGNRGVVFRVSTNGGDLTVVHHFTASGGDGRGPIGPLIEGQDGALYGATQSGGASDRGIAFKMNKDGTSYSVLKSFTTLPGDGVAPPGGLIQDANGWLYGALSSQPTVSGGAVYLLSPVPTAILEPPAATSAALSLEMLGSAFVNYRLQGASNLANPIWTDTATNITGAGGRVTFSNLPTVLPAQFYQIVTP